MSLISKILRVIFITLLIIVLIAAGSAIYAFKIAPHTLKTTAETISDSEVNGSFKIVVFADTHFSSDYTISDFQKAVDAINKQDADVVLFLGDLIDEYDSYKGDTSAISSALAKIKADKGKYAVFGNHDYGGGAENYYEKIMSAGGFTVLKNETVKFKSLNITLTGLDDFLLGYGNISCLSDLSASTYNIVACHEPDIVDRLDNSPADLMLSGHTHGGQVEIPFYGNLYLPSLGTKYIKGRYDIDNAANTVLYVNRGLGTTRVSARFLSSPEVTCISIK